MDLSNNTWKRRKSQKPDDELYSTFKQTFTELGPQISAALPSDAVTSVDDPHVVPITLAGLVIPLLSGILPSTPLPSNVPNYPSFHGIYLLSLPIDIADICHCISGI